MIINILKKVDIVKLPKTNVKLISNENSGILDIYLIKNELKDKNEKIFDKILSTLSKSESYKSKKIELIDNSFIIEDHEGNVLQEHLNNIKIEHVYYINNDIKKDFNIKIATFANV